MTCPKINNQATLDLTGHQPMFDSFFPYSQKTLGYEAHPAVNFISDKENAVNPLGKTGFYDPSSKEITIYTDGRHIKDVLRSIAHELVHHAQNERGEFDQELDTSPGYALEDGHLWNMEQEAYKDGNSCFRRWEDTYKQQLQESKKMKSNKIQEMVRKELKKILSEQEYTSAFGGDYTPGMSMQRQSPASAADLATGHKRKRTPVTNAATMLQAKLNLALVKLGKPTLKIDGQAGRKTRTARRFIGKQRKRGEGFNDVIARLAGISSEAVEARARMLATDDAAVDPDALPSQLVTADPDSALGKIMDPGAAGALDKKMAAAMAGNRGKPKTKLPSSAIAKSDAAASEIGQAVAGVTDGPPKFNWNAPNPVAAAATAPKDSVDKSLKQLRRNATRARQAPTSIQEKRAIRILSKLMEKIGNK